MIGNILNVILLIAQKLAKQSAPEAIALAEQFLAVGVAYIRIAGSSQLSKEEKTSLYTTEVDSLKQLISAAERVGTLELSDIPSTLLAIMGSDVLNALGI